MLQIRRECEVTCGGLLLNLERSLNIDRGSRGDKAAGLAWWAAHAFCARVSGDDLSLRLKWSEWLGAELQVGGQGCSRPETTIVPPTIIQSPRTGASLVQPLSPPPWTKKGSVRLKY